ncbi:MAG: alpha-L-rhamnosidase N-terminal domain-containing protein, partial [Clostridiales bacterium]|nr:alpha-L-rhamnosidase N-terminal domain-containing protein [Clostridiales bacterium]
MQAIDLRTQNLKNPLGLQTTAPNFGWKLVSDERGQMQTAYRIVAATTKEKLLCGDYDLWDSGRVKSACHYAIRYEGRALRTAEAAFWRVMVWDRDGNASAFSEWAFFEMGLLSLSDWHAKWIGAGKTSSRAPILSKEFAVQKEVASARLYISGLGLYEAHLNGVMLGEGTYFNPGESDVRKTVYYDTYDITEMLNEKNAISVLLGNGQYANWRIHRQQGRYYKIDDARSVAETEGMFGRVKAIAQVVLSYADGTKEIIGTDESWHSIESPITENSWYGGEDYDATLEIKGWNDVSPAIPRSEWGRAALIPKTEIPKGKLIGRECEPITACDVIPPENISVKTISEKDGY